MPTIIVKVGYLAILIAGLRSGSDAVQRDMNADRVIVILEIQSLPFEIARAPEWNVIEVFPSDGPTDLSIKGCERGT